MSKTTAIQTAINQASLTLDVGEDVFKALKASETHPALAKLIMNMHHSLRQQEREIFDLRSSMLQIAAVAARGADMTAAIMTGVDQLATRLGYDPSSLFAPEPADATTTE